MTKIKASGIPFCGSYRDAIAEKEYNIAQCQDYIAVLEADNNMLRKALQDIVDNEVGTAYETAYQALKPNVAGEARASENSQHEKSR